MLQSGLTQHHWVPHAACFLTFRATSHALQPLRWSLGQDTGLLGKEGLSVEVSSLSFVEPKELACLRVYVERLV